MKIRNRENSCSETKRETQKSEPRLSLSSPLLHPPREVIAGEQPKPLCSLCLRRVPVLLRFVLSSPSFYPLRFSPLFSPFLLRLSDCGSERFCFRVRHCTVRIASASVLFSILLLHLALHCLCWLQFLLCINKFLLLFLLFSYLLVFIFSLLHSCWCSYYFLQF